MRMIDILLLLVLVSCTKPTEPDIPGEDPVPETGLPDISKFSFGDIFTIPFDEDMVLPYGGLKAGDVINLIPRYDESQSYQMLCKAVDEKIGATFSVPDKFIGGMCNISLQSSSVTISGETFVHVKDTYSVEKHPGMTTYGRVIDYDGNPISGVTVSDGVMTTVTDDDGCYWMASMRKYGYVFISVPSGYNVAVNRTVPQFFSRFESEKSSDYEIHNFILAPQENVHHRTIVFTDTHLARRTDDLNQFENYFKEDIREQILEAKNDGVSLYALALGDLAWDEYWYANSYSLENYYQTMSDLDIPIFSIPGNHDNDPYIADDFLSENAFRANLCPTYYSMNIGNIHYIMMDNTIFRNSGASQGVIGNVQDYSEGLTSDQLKWLQSDLQHVEPGTAVVFGMHIQYTGRPSQKSNGSFEFSYSMPAEFRQELQSLLDPYDVHIVSGHTHINYTNKINDNFIEHNICGVCGTWWWTGYYSSNRCRINGDGSPSGYKIFEAGKNSPSSLSWTYKAVARPSSYQFRAYDLNNCHITRSLYCPASSNPKVSDSFFSQYACGYDTSRSDNKILVNVFGWEDDWTVSITENGRELTVERVDEYDPLHIVHFNMARMNTNSTSMTFPTSKSSHMFMATAAQSTSSLVISVKDSFGRIYTETMQRPRYLYDMSKQDCW